MSTGRPEHVLHFPVTVVLNQQKRVRLDMDPVTGNLLFQFPGTSGEWETKKQLTPAGVLV